MRQRRCGERWSGTPFLDTARRRVGKRDEKHVNHVNRGGHLIGRRAHTFSPTACHRVATIVSPRSVDRVSAADRVVFPGSGAEASDAFPETAATGGTVFVGHQLRQDRVHVSRVGPSRAFHPDVRRHRTALRPPVEQIRSRARRIVVVCKNTAVVSVYSTNCTSKRFITLSGSSKKMHGYRTFGNSTAVFQPALVYNS